MSENTNGPVTKEMQAFQEGALVSLSIGKKSWTNRLTPKDMGLAEFPANWTPGRRLLLPDESLAAIDLIEGQSRTFLDDVSFVFGGKKLAGKKLAGKKGARSKRRVRGKFRFVHVSKLASILQALETRKEEFEAAVRMLEQNYLALQKQMENDFPAQWPSLKPLYPEFSEIQDAYYFEIDIYEMVFPTGLTAMKRYELEQLEKSKELTEQDKEAHRQRLERIEREQREAAEARVEELVESAVRGLREQVVAVFVGITEKITNNKSLIKPNLDAIRNVIDHVKDMDFLHDDAFHARLEEVKLALGATDNFKDDASATAALQKAMENTMTFVTDTTDATVATIKKSYFKRQLAL